MGQIGYGLNYALENPVMQLIKQKCQNNGSGETEEQSIKINNHQTYQLVQHRKQISGTFRPHMCKLHS